MQTGESDAANLVANGVLQDFTDWAQAQPWYADMDPNALDACTFDGKLYCFPIAETPQVTFVWKDHFPNGYPTTPAEFEAEAERLKAEGISIWTYFGSTDFDGGGTNRATWTTVSSFGGTFDDGQGNLLLNTPENVAAAEFMRKAAQEGWTTEVSFAGGFQEEEAFKDASAASIPTGIFGYRYIRPLTAPNGNTYTTETEQDMLDAIEAGDVILAPFIAAEGQKPGCGLAVSALVMPVGAKNPEAAYDYINWLMTERDQNADWVVRGAAGIPTLLTAFDQPQFQTQFYQQAKSVVEASACRPWQGSLARTAEARPTIMNAFYKVVWEDPEADIAAVFQAAQDEFNGGVEVVAPEPTAVEPAGEVQDFVTWYQFDQDNEDPANDEAVGNAYLRDTIPQFNEAFAGKWNWVNVPKAWDKMEAELQAAVIAGGDVPDLMHTGDPQTVNLARNGVLQDFTEWAEAQPWYSDMDPNAIKACTVDGKLYCLPVAEQPYVTFVWKDHFPNGFPATPEEFEAEAERLKAEGINIWTYFGSTDFDGGGVQRGSFTVIASFGGAYDDGQGNMALNTPENVKAVEFLRKAAQEGWTTEVSFAGGFQEEEAFKDASAASIPTGIFGYRYIRPLTAPNGNTYTTETEQDMLDAIEAGDVIVTPWFAAEGHKPGCNLALSVLVMPKGAQNPEAAYDYITWLMTDVRQNVDWVTRPGSGLPVLQTTFNEPEFSTKFNQQAKDLIAASECRPWIGTLPRIAEARPFIMNTIYKLVWEDPGLDIATELQEASDEFNAAE
jgi:multiple sugar transport system substrate-binding protein